MERKRLAEQILKIWSIYVLFMRVILDAKIESERIEKRYSMKTVIKRELKWLNLSEK